MANSLWALQVIGKSLVVGGESGILQVLNIDWYLIWPFDLQKYNTLVNKSNMIFFNRTLRKHALVRRLVSWEMVARTTATHKRWFFWLFKIINQKWHSMTHIVWLILFCCSCSLSILLVFYIYGIILVADRHAPECKSTRLLTIWTVWRLERILLIN